MNFGISEAVWEEIEYQQRGAPGHTVESAMAIPGIWLDDELESARIRGDIACIQSIGDAALVRQEGTSGAELVRTASALEKARLYTLELTQNLASE